MTKPPPIPPMARGAGSPDGSGQGQGPDSARTARHEGVEPRRGKGRRSGERLRSEIAFRPVDTRRQFGRFQLLMELAQGGMATLYLARLQGPEQFQKLLAIKKIHDHLAREEEFIGMFLDEARITALIHHPNVAAIFDLGQVEGAYFLAMEYVHGENLTTILRTSARLKQRLPWEYAVRIVADAAAGLHAAHEIRGPDGKLLGIVHRDVSPQNILVSYEGHVKVVDFGIAYAAERITHTMAGTLKGKVSYMSPEQTERKPLDRRSDIFSLGIVLFEAVCLKRLFREENEAATLLRVRSADVPRPRSIRPDMPTELERIILKALAKDPEDRFQTAQELEEALNRLLVAKGKVVGPPQLADFMDRLFHEKKRIKDEQIRRALETTSGEPIEGFGMGGTTGTQFEPPSVAKAPRWRFWAPVIGGGLFLLVGGGLAFWSVFGSRDTPHGERRRPEPSAPVVVDAAVRPPRVVLRDAGKPKLELVRLRIQVRPAKAEAVVIFRGREYPGPVFETKVPKGRARELILVRAKGFQPKTIEYRPDRDREISVMLRRKVRPRRERLLDLPGD